MCCLKGILDSASRSFAEPFAEKKKHLENIHIQD